MVNPKKFPLSLVNKTANLSLWPAKANGNPPITWYQKNGHPIFPKILPQ